MSCPAAEQAPPVGGASAVQQTLLITGLSQLQLQDLTCMAADRVCRAQCGALSQMCLYARLSSGELPDLQMAQPGCIALLHTWS